MKVRKLDAAGDMSFGRGAADFWSNSPDGVAQCVLTRLRLQQGEWFLNTADGTAWKTQVLGKRTEATRDFIVRARIVGTQGVKELTTYSSQLDRNLRGFSVQATIKTIYGDATVSGPV